MKDVVGYEGNYLISEDGEVYSVIRGIRLKQFSKNADSNSYRRVELSLNGVKRKHQVHRLVAEAYLGKPEEFMVVNHKNGIKYDNRVLNLEWVTQKQNDAHARINGLTPSLLGNKQKRNTSGYVGVTKSGNKWKAQMRLSGKLHYFGLYDTPEEASKAYTEAFEGVLAQRGKK